MNEREHAPYHERRLEQQQLDALLRIEELLKEFLVLLPVIAPAPEKEPEEREDVLDPDGHKVGTVRKGKRK
jgi:hypothetical protein